MVVLVFIGVGEMEKTSLSHSLCNSFEEDLLQIEEIAQGSTAGLAGSIQHAHACFSSDSSLLSNSRNFSYHFQFIPMRIAATLAKCLGLGQPRVGRMYFRLHLLVFDLILQPFK